MAKLGANLRVKSFGTELQLTQPSSSTNWSDFYSNLSTEELGFVVDELAQKPVDSFQWFCNNLSTGKVQKA